MKKRNVVVAAVLLVAAAVCTVSCGKKEEKPKAKLVYWTMWNEAEPQGTVIARAVEAFTKETGIEVEVNFNGREIRKTLQPALDAGETIDLFDEDIERVLNTWGNYLLPLDTYTAKAYSTTGGKPYNTVVNQTLYNLAKELGGGTVKNIPYQPLPLLRSITKIYFQKQVLPTRLKHGMSSLSHVRSSRCSVFRQLPLMMRIWHVSSATIWIAWLVRKQRWLW